MHRITEPSGAASAIWWATAKVAPPEMPVKYALLLRQGPCPFHALGPGDGHHFVIELLIDRFLQHIGNEIRRPALDRVRLEGWMAGGGCATDAAFLRLAAADKLRVGRLAENDPRLRTLAAQHAATPAMVPPVP